MKYKYNWDNFPEIKSLLKKIYINSQEELSINNYDSIYANEFINDIEDYLNYFKTFNYNLKKIVSSISEIDCITFQKPFYIDLSHKTEPDYQKMPPVINLTTKILLNPKIVKNNKLTERERRRLYLYHGLSHSIFNLKNEKTLEFSKMYNLGYTKEGHEIELIVNNGWLLLEESLSQMLAERITYFILKKQKPGISPGPDKDDIIVKNKHLVLSDLDLYRTFQPILLLFCMTLSNIGSLREHSREMIIYDTLKKSINGTFSSEIISEYIEKDKEFELYKVLYYMGLLVNEKYATFGFRQLPNIKLEEYEIEKVYLKLSKILAKMYTLEENIYSKDVKIYKKKLRTNQKEQLYNIFD